MEVSTLYNGNVYLDGTSNLLGKAKQITLPVPTVVKMEHSALGMFGKLEFPVGIEALAATVVWAGFYPEVLAVAGDPFTSRKLQVRGSVETYGAAGRTSESPFVAQLTARWNTNPLGDLQPQTNVELTHELSVSYVKVTVGARELLEVDVIEQVWKADGRDLLAKYKQHLGL